MAFTHFCHIRQSVARSQGLIFLVMLVAMTTCNVVAAQDRALSPSEIFKAVSQSVVTIHTYDKDGNGVKQGSGVVVYPDVVVSNCHVIVGSSSIEVRNTKFRYVATIRHVDPKRDLCSLDVDALDLPTVLIGSSRNLQIGANIYAVGSPKGYELTFSDGLLSGFRAAGDSQRLQITAPISHGSSGGGLFDSKARLIGITSSGREDGQQLNFAIPVEWISELPKRHELSVAAFNKMESEKAPEQTGVKKEFLDFQTYLRKNDAEVYRILNDDWLKAIVKIGNSFPESEWLTESKNAYYELRSKYIAQKNSVPIKAPASAEVMEQKDPRWRLVTKEGDGSEYMDMKARSRTGNVVIASIKKVYRAPSVVGHYTNVGTQIMEYKYDCKDRMAMLMTFWLYSTHGKVLHESTAKKWDRVIPGSLGEAALEMACLPY